MSKSKKTTPPDHEGKGFLALAGEAFSVLGEEIVEGKDKIVAAAGDGITAVKETIIRITAKKKAAAKKKAPVKKAVKKATAKKAVKKAAKKVARKAAPKKAVRKAVKKKAPAKKKAPGKKRK